MSDIVSQINDLGDALRLGRTIATDDAVARTRNAACIITNLRAKHTKAEAALARVRTVLQDTKFRMSLPDIRELVADEPWLERLTECLASLTEGEPE